MPSAVPRTVLVLDNGSAALARVTDVLADDSLEVIGARTIPEALGLLAVRHIDCVLVSDDADGRNTSERIKREAARPAPVVVITTLDDPQRAARVLNGGADDCISLATDCALFKARVHAQLRRGRSDGDLRASAVDARAALERKEQELSALNYAVSHDLRAPLRAIEGFSRILLEDCLASLDPQHADYLQRIGRASREMGGLIDDLLQLSRVGRAELRRGRLDLSELARRVAGDLRERSGREVDVQIEDGLVVDADRRLMQIVLEHLFGNGWKFTAGTAAARIECRAHAASGGPAFVVSDNGVGFDMSQAGKLFKPFQRLHGRADFDGTGIGLAVVHRIIDRHGGRVWAEAREGQGAAFFFTVPAA